MASNYCKLAYIFQLLCIIGVVAQSQGQDGDLKCGGDELDHSILVECGADAACNGTIAYAEPTRPQHDEVTHIYSTRSGKRLEPLTYKRMRYTEDDMEKSLNINTTMYVDTSKKSSKSVLGFGTTLDTVEMLSQINSGIFGENYGRTLKDLISMKQHGIGYTVFRLNLTKDSLTPSDLSMVLHHIETFAETANGRDSNENSRIDIILGLADLSTTDDVENLRAVVDTFNSSMILNAHAIVLSESHFDTQDEFINQLKELFPSVKILASVELQRAPKVLDHLVSIKADMDGLLIESEAAIPYDVFDYLITRKEGLELIVTSRPRPKVKVHGDWQNAQDYATEIINHLRHEVNGFIEGQFPIVDILSSPNSEDCAIYSLRRSNQVHFRGPIFYAVGQFSRYLGKNFLALPVDLFTQPNMFAAKYSAFLTADNHVVAVVLNDNEHLLPFRLAVDNKIEVYAALESKSFNTFVLKNN